MDEPKEVEISVMCVRLDDPDTVCGYSCGFTTKEEAIEGVVLFVDKMTKDGWIPTAILVDGKPVYVGVIMENIPFSVN